MNVLDAVQSSVSCDIAHVSACLIKLTEVQSLQRSLWFTLNDFFPCNNDPECSDEFTINKGPGILC